MIKRFCDVCGKETDTFWDLALSLLNDHRVFKLELCGECLDKLMDYIHDRQIEHSINDKEEEK